MNHSRIFRAVLWVSAGYAIVLAIWLGWLVEKSPPGTLPYQIVGLVAGFGAALGLAMMIAGRSTGEHRRLMNTGIEGWATVEASRALEDRRTELDLEFTVPGVETYYGKIVYDIPVAEESRFRPGSILSVIVDPTDRDRIVLLPQATHE